MSEIERFKKYTDDELVEHGSTSGIGGPGETKVYGGAADPRYQIEMTRRLKDSILQLNISLKNFNERTSYYSKWLIILTIVLLIFAGIQIILLFR